MANNATRDSTDKENAVWLKFKTQFESSTKPKVQGLVLLAKTANAIQNTVQELTGSIPDLVDTDFEARVNQLGNMVQTIDNQITGVILKKYAISVDKDTGELQILAAPGQYNEGDVLTFSGFGNPLVYVAIGAVVLLAGGFITLKVVEERTKAEVQNTLYKMQRLNAHMATQPEAIRKAYDKSKEQITEQVKAAAKQIPGATGLIEKFLGSKGATIAIAAAVGIAALYFLIPRLQRN